MNLNDWITLGLFFLLFGMAGAAIGYLFGICHGHESGYLAGAADEHRQSLRRCIQAKRDSFKLGSVVTIARLLGSEPTLRGHSRPSIQHPFQGGTDPMDKTARHLPVSARNSSN